jgi:hypothetical protein
MKFLCFCWRSAGTKCPELGDESKTEKIISAEIFVDFVFLYIYNDVSRQFDTKYEVLLLLFETGTWNGQQL